MQNVPFQHESSQGYQDFLASKRLVSPTSGIEVALDDIHPMLFPFQKTLVQWALRKGRAAIFADTGLGKTLISVECARDADPHSIVSVFWDDEYIPRNELPECIAPLDQQQVTNASVRDAWTRPEKARTK